MRHIEFDVVNLLMLKIILIIIHEESSVKIYHAMNVGESSEYDCFGLNQHQHLISSFIIYK